MKTVTFTYQIVAEKKGYFVKCLDWDCVYSQGETIAECKENMIEVTEMFMEELINKTLLKSQYPKIKKHIADPLQFQLTFDIDKVKYIDLLIPFKQVFCCNRMIINSLHRLFQNTAYLNVYQYYI